MVLPFASRVARRPTNRQNASTQTADDADERGYEGMDDDDQGHRGAPRSMLFQKNIATPKLDASKLPHDKALKNRYHAI